MPGARIIVTNHDTGGVRASITNEKGEFVATGLAPGLYTISVQATGFNTAEKTGILLQPGLHGAVEFRLTAPVDSP